MRPDPRWHSCACAGGRAAAADRATVNTPPLGVARFLGHRQCRSAVVGGGITTQCGWPRRPHCLPSAPPEGLPPPNQDETRWLRSGYQERQPSRHRNRHSRRGARPPGRPAAAAPPPPPPPFFCMYVVFCDFHRGRGWWGVFHTPPPPPPRGPRRGALATPAPGPRRGAPSGAWPGQQAGEPTPHRPDAVGLAHCIPPPPPFFRVLGGGGALPPRPALSHTRSAPTPLGGARRITCPR